MYYKEMLRNDHTKLRDGEYPMNITIKENAKEMLKNKLEKNQFLRVAVIEGGCAGLTYSAVIDKEMKEDDKVVLQTEDVKIVSTDTSIPYLDGLTIDYSNELINGGLQFTNSKTKSTCGCGQSFNLSGFPALDKGKCAH